MPSLLGIDLGGTKTLMARYDAQSLKFQRIEKFPTHAHKAFDHVREDLMGQIEELRADDTAAIGIGIPGLIDHPTRKIITMPNIPGAEGFDLGTFITDRTRLPIIVENDVHCFTLGEALFGAGQGHRVVVGVTLGTGVGGGVVVDGKIFEGAHGFAAEVGHMLLMPGLPPYAAEDKRGEVEQFLSGSALRRRCSQAQEPHELLSGETCSFLHPDIYREIAWFVTNLTYAYDPSIIIFGGGVGRSLVSHLPAIEQEVRRWILPHTPVPHLATSTLDDAAVRGAAWLARGAVTLR